MKGYFMARNSSVAEVTFNTVKLPNADIPNSGHAMNSGQNVKSQM